MKAVIYCRVSTKEQVQNFSLSTQQAECRRWCQQNGYEVDRVFIDQGESAKTANRPEFLNMLAHCRLNKNSVSAVIVHSMSRFSRNTLDHHATRGLLMGLGVTLRSVTEPTDDSPEGRFIEDLMAGLANYDNRAKARRTKTGMTAALQAGRWTFSAPLGYLNSRNRAEPSLIGDPERAPLVRQAFEEFAAGHRTRAEVLARATAVGLRTAKGQRLTPQTFHALLRNPIYCGRIVVPRLGVDGRGDFEPLVPADVFDRVQALLSGRRKAVVPHLRNHPDFPLRRFVGCGTCGTPLTGSWSTGRRARYAYYHCRACGTVKVRREQLEQQFVALLESLQPNLSYMRLFREIVRDVWLERQSSAESRRAVAEGRAGDLRLRLDRVEDAFVQDRTIDRQSYERQRDKLREDLTLVEIEVADAKLEEVDVDGVLAFAETVLTDASRLWTASSLDQKQRLQSVLFPEGLKFDGQQFGTAATCLAFKQLRDSQPAPEGMASPTGSVEHWRPEFTTFCAAVGRVREPAANVQS